MANKPFKKLRFSLTGDTYSPVDEQARQNIGDLSQLETTNKSNLVEAINEARQSGSGSGVPSGGNKGQVLTKLSSVEGDADWEYPPIMTASGNDPSNLTVSWNENFSAFDFFSRQELLQAQYIGSVVAQLKLVKAYITATAPDYVNEYHFEFGAITEISNGTATIATLEVVCDSPSAHSGVGVYTEVSVGVSDEAVQDAVDEYLTEHPALTGMFTNAAKNSLIALLEKVAYIDQNGQTYLDELIANLAATVTSIDAVFTQGSTVIYYTDSLDTLRQHLVVTANYSDETSAAVSSYTLSGTLVIGETCTVTVTYGGKTDTFTVNVSNFIKFSIAQGSSDYGTTNAIKYNGSETTRCVINPMAIKVPAGRYKFSLGTYNGTTTYYMGFRNGYATGFDNIDWSVSFGTSKTFISNATDLSWNFRDTEDTTGWKNNIFYLDVASDKPYLFVNFKKGSAGTSAFNSTDISNLRNNVTIEKVAIV